MTDLLWDKVDGYFNEKLLKSYYSEALEKQNMAGLPDINVTPTQGMFLRLVSLTLGSKRILELGTLGGYSTIWLASSLDDDGKLISLELNEKHADVARKNIDAAGLGKKVEIKVGNALDSLPKLLESELPPFDLIFIDADKTNIPEYFAWALRLTKSGSLIVVDNTVRGGKVIDESTDDPAVLGVRRLVNAIGKSGKVEATAIQTVGSKGHDGFIIMRVK